MTRDFIHADPPRGVFIVGAGGGGDVVQTIPLANFFRRLGVEKIVLGEINVKWWDRPGFIPIGAELTPLDWFSPGDRLGEDAVRVQPTTRTTNGTGANAPLFEAEVARVSGLPTYVMSISNGQAGFAQACRDIMAEHELDTFVVVDVGADAFFTGTETTVQSPLADAYAIATATDLGGIYALTGYGCDAELSLDSLRDNMAKVMHAGGYLGAYGLTPTDVAQLDDVLAAFPDEEVEVWPRNAAKGVLGHRIVKGWWSVEVTALAAVNLFFEAAALEKVNPCPGLIRGTASLADSEQRIMAETAVVPETLLPEAISMPAAGFAQRESVTGQSGRDVR